MPAAAGGFGLNGPSGGPKLVLPRGAESC